MNMLNVQRKSFHIAYLCGGGWVYLHSFIYFIFWSSRVGAFLLCYDSIVPCTSEGDISANAICHLWRFILIDWYRGRPS